MKNLVNILTAAAANRRDRDDSLLRATPMSMC